MGAGCVFRYVKLLVSGALALGITGTPAKALTINDTFLDSITSSANAASIESAITAASNQMASLFTDPITVEILFGISGSVAGGQSQSGYYNNSYSAYTALLTSDAFANPQNSTLSTAVSNLSVGNDASGTRPISSTSANLRALGQPASGTFDASGAFHSGGGQLYDGVITINPTYATRTSVVQHEIDEILGGGGSGSTLGTNEQVNGNSGSYGGTDLYRYSSPGTPSYSTGATSAYLSVDGGATQIASFNQNGQGDFGDFTTNPCLIQSWQICSNPDVFTTASAEYTMLEAIGYDPISTTPLPTTWPLLLSGFLGLGFFAYIRPRRRPTAFIAVC